MSAHEIVINLMAAFAVLGALDRILGNRLGLGKEFEEGILAMGSLAMAMLGIITLAPVLAALLKPIIVPVFGFLGADPGGGNDRRSPGRPAGRCPHRLHAGGDPGFHHPRGYGHLV